MVQTSQLKNCKSKPRAHSGARSLRICETKPIKAIETKPKILALCRQCGFHSADASGALRNEAKWNFRARRSPWLQRRTLPPDIAVDPEVVVAVDRAVVIEIAVRIPEGGSGHADVGVDDEVIVSVDDAVEVGVAGVGVLDDDAGGIDGFAIVEEGCVAGEIECVAGFGDGEGGVSTSCGGEGAADARAQPVPAVAPFGDQSEHAAVTRSVPRSHRRGAGVIEQQ